MRVFIFGAGYSARAFARTIRGRAEFIGGTTRAPENAPALHAAGVEPCLFDGAELTPEIAGALADTTHLVVSVAPGAAGDPVLRAASEAIRRMPALRWIAYLSTVGVYGDHAGAWVDETSECRPASRRSIERLAAEEDWAALAGEISAPLAILRLSGIYGPGRNAFINLAAGNARRIVKPGQVFNRIHVEDIAGALKHFSAADAPGIFNVTDDEPAPPQDVVALAAGLMGVEPPPEIPFDAAELTPMARSFYGENKRVSNERLRAAGYRLIHPDYRRGLTRLWAEGGWRKEAG